MTDETPQEAPSEEQVTLASEAPQEKSSTEYVSREDLDAFGAKLAESISKEIVPRLKQSQKDVIQDRVSSEVKEKLSAFDEAVEMLTPHLSEDVDLKALKRQKFIDSLMSESPSPEGVPEQAPPPQEAVPEPASSPPSFEAEIQTILDAHGISGEEPELLEYAEKNKGKPWWQIGTGFNELAQSLATRQAGTPAGVVPPQGQVAHTDLIKEFNQEVDAYLNPRGGDGKLVQGQRRSIQRLRTLQQKYVDQGVPIEELDISPKSKAPKSISDWTPPG
jgi:hypothetical protein